MGMSQGVGRDRSSPELAKDPAAIVPCPRVHQDITQEVYVERVRGEAAELVETFGQWLHERLP
jgi:hypothetical protein